MTAIGLPDNVFICLDLKKGGKVIAGTCIVSSLISFIMLWIYLGKDFDEIAKEIGAEDPAMVQKLKHTESSAQAVAWTFLLTSAALFVSSIVLVKGVQNDKQKFLVPFLGVVAVSIAICVVIALINFNFAIASLAVALIYFFICIYSLYKHLDAAVRVPQCDVESH